MHISLHHRLGLKLLALVLLLSGGSLLHAQQIYRYTSNLQGVPFSVAANSSGSNLTRVNGAALPATTCGTGFNSNQWSLLGVVNLNGPAVEVIVTPNPGYYLNLTSFSAGMRRNTSGPPILKFAYSIDGGSTWVQQTDFQAPFSSGCGTTQVGSWDFPDFSVNVPIRFRLYGFSATSATNGQLQILNLNVNGSVSTSPVGSPAFVAGQPSSITVCEGSNAGFSITATGTPTPTVQWQLSTNGGASYSNIPGATGLSYSFTASNSQNGNRYRAFVTNVGGSDTSSAAILTVNPLATVNAGPGALICASSNHSLNGTIGGGASSATWSTAGDGTFGNASSLSTTYIPGTNDKLNGSVVLTLTTNDPAGPCGSAASSLTLTIDPAATANAGADLSTCQNNPVNLAGIIGGAASSSLWSSSGDGVFGNPSDPITTYTPGSADLLNGTVTLSLSTNDPAGNCPAASDNLVLSVGSLPLVNAGTDFGICASATAALSGSVSGSVSTGTWSTAGDGNFINNTLLNAVYSPGPNDILNGTVVLTLTSADPVGPCGPVSDNLTLSITSPPAAPAAITGPTDVCAGTNGVPYSIDPVSGATSYIWSSASWVTINGSGTAVTMNFASPISNSGTFIWVKAANSCGTSADSSKRYIRHSIDVPQFVVQPTVVCKGSTGVLYKIRPIEGYSSIVWSVTGAISIVSTTDSTAIVDFGATFTSGSITATANHPCITTTRTVSVTQGITRVPGNISGPAFGVCDSTVSYSISPVLGSSSYLWTAPAGATIIGSATGTGVTVQFASNYVTGSLSVVAFNSCNLAGGARALTVRGTPQGPNAIFGPTSVCANQTGVVFSVNPTPATWSYLWTVPSSATILSGQGSTSITVKFGLAGGNINVRSVRPCGQSGAFSRNVPVTCRIADEIPEFSLFPNPVNDQLFVQGLPASNDAVLYEVLDLSGRICAKEQWNPDALTTVPVNDLQEGVYLLRVYIENQILNKQFVVKH